VKAYPTNVFLIEILKPLAHMSIDMYIQEATLSYDKRLFFVRRSPKGGRGVTSVSVKNVKILAQNIIYL
jgi:hypothetical protein